MSKTVVSGADVLVYFDGDSVAQGLVLKSQPCPVSVGNASCEAFAVQLAAQEDKTKSCVWIQRSPNSLLVLLSHGAYEFLVFPTDRSE